MKIAKRLIPFGMIAVASFLLLDILGKILWPEYNPVTTYVSALVTDEAPHVHLFRFFLNAYSICFLLFSLGMVFLSIRKYHMCVKAGYIIMLVTAAVTAIGFGAYPISMALIFKKNNIVHLVVTITILSSTIIAMLLIALGYIKKEGLKTLGYICLAACMLYVGFNIWHLYALLNGIVILGLIERCIFYTFHALTIALSWLYTFRKSKLIDL